MKRPPSIIWFERLNLLSLALVVPNDYFAWDELMIEGANEFMSPIAMILLSQGIALAIALFLILMVSRARSRVFKWIYTVMVAIGVILTFAALPADIGVRPIFAAITVLQTLLTIVGTALLFRADAMDWFAGRDPVDTEIFR